MRPRKMPLLRDSRDICHSNSLPWSDGALAIRHWERHLHHSHYWYIKILHLLCNFSSSISSVKLPSLHPCFSSILVLFLVTALASQLRSKSLPQQSRLLTHSTLPCILCNPTGTIGRYPWLSSSRRHFTDHLAPSIVATVPPEHYSYRVSDHGPSNHCSRSREVCDV